MKEKIKILFTDLAYLNHNYGAQGIAFPLIESLNEYFDAEYTFVLSEKYYDENSSFSKKNGFNIVVNPRSGAILERGWFFVYVLYPFIRLFKKKIVITEDEKKQFSILVEGLKESDIVIDLSGIEFIGQRGFKGRCLNYINAVYMRYMPRLAEKYNKPYLKYTKSYGPFPDKIYRFFVRRQLNKLPFVFVRGESNLEDVKKLNLKVPLYSFPDISFILEPESKDWAVGYIANLGLDSSKPIAGISPSSVISNIHIYRDNSSCGLNHIRLSKEIIKFYQQKGQQVLLIPHSLGDGKDLRSCDLSLSKKIYTELEDKVNVFMISDMTLTYKQVRAIIGLLDFYVTGRYHSVSSALSMGIPVVALSWHIKYKDIMSLFLDDILAIDCRITNIKESLSLITKYYNDRQWFNKDEVLKRKESIIKQIDRSINILVDEIKKDINL